MRFHKGAGISIDENIGVSNEDFPKLNVENNVYHFVSGLDGYEDDAIVRVINGQIYFNGNIFPDGENDAYVTSDKHDIPDYAKVTMFQASELGDSVVPYVGTHYPTSDEAALLEEIRLALNEADISFQPVAQSLSKKFNQYSILDFYNIRGQLVKQLKHATAEGGQPFTTGVYISVPQADNCSVHRKLIFIK